MNKSAQGNSDHNGHSKGLLLYYMSDIHILKTYNAISEHEDKNSSTKTDYKSLKNVYK